MKKSILLAALVASASASAQLTDGSICPDFTGVDLNGNTHHLYNYLDQGWTVVIDVSAAWCGPCWNYHESHALRDLYNSHGPSTNDKVMVLYVEGEDSNTLAQLQGTTTNNQTSGYSQGDWITGTPYPIIDDANIANTLDISYFPTIYMVCPNRRVSEVGQRPAATLWNLVQSPCKVNGGNLAVTNYGGATSTCGVEDMPVRIANYGSTPMTSATVTVKQGATTLATQNWSGNLNTWQTADLTFNNVTITNAPDVTINITNPDAVLADNTLDPNMTNAVPVSWAVTVEGKVDNYPTEFSWHMKDPNGVVIASGGNYATVNENNYCNGSTPNSGGYGSGATFAETIQLNQLGCYKVEAFDSYGDGLTGSASSYFRVRNSNNLLVVDVDFFCGSSSAIVADAVGISEGSLSNTLNIYPNPTNGVLNVTFKQQGNEATFVRVFDLLGKEVVASQRVVGTGEQSQTVDLSGLQNGMYYLQLQSGSQKVTRKVTLTR
ncbi:MAG: T9SS type A sorting domain-containing protein [Flavobacteriales bacterium]|nr:T9SS type A sorting domain-containing protein [Flavobacteriales bacterium]